MASRVRVPIRGLAEGTRELDAEQSHYLTRVLRLREGETFVAFDPACAVECDAVLVRVDEGRATADLGATRAAEVRASRRVTLLQGLAKGEKCDAIVRDATELGVTRIILAKTERSVVRLDAARGDARVVRWVRIAEEAARQCGRGDPPTIALMEWREALADVAGDADAARFCLYEEALEPLGAHLAGALARLSPLAFAVGPEGGLTPDEVADASAAGFAILSLGPFILRTETVAAAVLGACLVYDPELARITRS